MKNSLSKKLLIMNVMGLGLIGAQLGNPEESSKLLKQPRQDLDKKTQSNRENPYQIIHESPHLFSQPTLFDYSEQTVMLTLNQIGEYLNQK